jgi:hypothetical protein
MAVAPGVADGMLRPSSGVRRGTDGPLVAAVRRLMRARVWGVAALVGVISAVAVVAPSAASGDLVVHHAVPVRRLLPPGRYAVIESLPDGRLAMNTRTKSGDILANVSLFDPASSASTTINGAGVRSCEQSHVYIAGILRDGRLMVREACFLGYGSARFRVVTLDPMSGAVDVLADVGDDLAIYGGVSFDDRLGYGYAGEDSDLAAHIARIGPFGIEPVHVFVGSKTQGFWLDEPERQACGANGRARGAQISPDAMQVAVIASLPARGVDGFACSDLPWRVYVFNEGDATSKAITPPLHYVTGVRWSPNGQWLAVSSGEGTHLVDLATREVMRITDEYVGSLVWAPDSSHLYGLQEVGKPTRLGDFPRTSLVELDLTNILG